MNKLQIDSILFEVNGRKILSDIYLELETGKITGLLGRNGEGKSCLMNIVFGSLIPQHKTLKINNKHINYLYLQKGILNYLPQFNFIPKHLTLSRIFKDFKIDFEGFSELFPEFSSRKKDAIADFSGGEKRLIEIYLIVKSKTHFSLLDEPFTHLNPIHIEKVTKFLNEEKHHKGLLITDHMHQHISSLTNEIYFLSKGKLVHSKNNSNPEGLYFT